MAAISSSSLSTVAIPVCSSSSISSRPQVSFLRSNPSTFMAAKQRLSSSRIVSVPQVSESTAVVASAEDEASSSTFVAGAKSEKVAPKQKMRIKLRSWVPLIEDSCKQIMDAVLQQHQMRRLWVQYRCQQREGCTVF